MINKLCLIYDSLYLFLNERLVLRVFWEQVCLQAKISLILRGVEFYHVFEIKMTEKELQFWWKSPF